MKRRAIAMLPVVGFIVSGAVATKANPQDFTLTSGDKTFQLSKAAGKYVAMHFLMAVEDPICPMYVREYAKFAPRVAGVEHVFMKPADEKAVEAFASSVRVKSPNVTIFRDADATLARQFNIPDGYELDGRKIHFPALIVLNTKGQEIYRYVGKDHRDRLPFSEFRFKMGDVTKSPALSQYNVKEFEPAMGGYDPVAYVENSQAQKGGKDMHSYYRGVLYYFVSAKNRSAFADNPEKYVPAYGGWCATGMAEGKKVDIDPFNFKVTNGRLFLFYKGFFDDAQKYWNKNAPTLTREADAAWQKLAPGDME